jgi:hypothetical protein
MRSAARVLVLVAITVGTACGSSASKPLSSPSPKPSGPDPGTLAYYKLLEDTASAGNDSRTFEQSCDRVFLPKDCRDWAVKDRDFLKSAIATLTAAHPPASFTTGTANLIQLMQQQVTNDTALIAAIDANDTTKAKADIDTISANDADQASAFHQLDPRL